MVDHDRTLYDALAMPRPHQQWLPSSVDAESFGLSVDARRALKAKEHTFSIRIGASDTRQTGAVCGY